MLSISKLCSQFQVSANRQTRRKEIWLDVIFSHVPNQWLTFAWDIVFEISESESRMNIDAGYICIRIDRYNFQMCMQMRIYRIRYSMQNSSFFPTSYLLIWTIRGRAWIAFIYVFSNRTKCAVRVCVSVSLQWKVQFTVNQCCNERHSHPLPQTRITMKTKFILHFVENA